MPKMYDLDVSGNCYKVRLFCAILGVPLELLPIDFMAGEHKQRPFTGINPFGELPVFIDGDVTLRDSQAILIYLARTRGGEAWFPTDAVSMARIMEWLSVAANEVARGPNDARLQLRFGYKLDGDLARTKAARILAIMNTHLATHDWLALGRPTIADIACMPYIAVGCEGGVTLDHYPAVAAWIGRIKALPGFIAMPGI